MYSKIKGGYIMGRNVQDHVESSISSMQNVISALQKAECNCEKESNKKVIRSAIESINCACDHLCEYCD